MTIKTLYKTLSEIKDVIETDCRIICDDMTVRIDLCGELVFKIWEHKNGQLFKYGCAFSEEKISNCPQEVIMLEMVHMITDMHEVEFPNPGEQQ